MGENNTNKQIGIIHAANKKIIVYIINLCNFFLQSEKATETEKEIIKEFKNKVKSGHKTLFPFDFDFSSFETLKELKTAITNFKEFVNTIDIENINTSDDYNEFTKDIFEEFVDHFGYTNNSVKLDGELKNVVKKLKKIVRENYIQNATVLEELPDKVDSNNFEVTVKTLNKMFDKLLETKIKEAKEIVQDITYSNECSIYTDVKRRSLLTSYHNVRQKPITKYDKDFYKKFGIIDNEVKKFLKENPTVSIPGEDDEIFSKKLAHFFEKDFLDDLKTEYKNDLNKKKTDFQYKVKCPSTSTTNYTTQPHIRFYRYGKSPLIPLMRAIKDKHTGGKRRRSTKRKTKRSKRKQKRNTKRRASHRRRR